MNNTEKTSTWRLLLLGMGCGSPQWRSDRFLQIFFLALMVLGPLSWDVHAHRVNVFAYVEGDSVVVQGYFGGKAKAMNCPVVLFDSSGKKLAEGKTDSKGLCSFKIAELPSFSGDLKVVLEAGSGHKAKYTVKAGELPDAASSRKPDAADESKSPVQKAVSTEPSPKAAQAMPAVDEKRIIGLMDQALDKRIGTIVKMLGNQQKLLLEQQKQGPGLTEIIGGIGWIFGLIGVAAYFMGRNGRKGP